MAGSKLVTCYMNDVKNTLQLRELDSGKVTYEFPLEIGSVTGFSGEIKYDEMFYKFSSQVTPGVIFHVNLAEKTPAVKVFLETKVAQFDSSQFKVEQVTSQCFKIRFYYRSSCRSSSPPKTEPPKFQCSSR